ncbi:AAA family ATPase [Clostridium sp.]|uniref:AAA family ATPase n=1 Tax=Clostridium sp. TaxID=1506 RepID=UPI00321806C5
MSYTYRQAINTLYEYLDIKESEVSIINDTNGRGIIYDFNGEKCVIFTYPISCKQNNTQNFFDTRDSGAKERKTAWDYAKENSLKYFCFGVNSEQERYKDYVFSLESLEENISNISYRKSDMSNSTGTQVNIPNDLIPSKEFERICTPKGFFIAFMNKSFVKQYMKIFDNRPYINNEDEQVDLTISYSSDFSRNRIIFGAPGTGKSFYLNNEKSDLLSVGGEYERVTFHPDYSYANFVGTYKPVPCKDSDGKDAITYEYVPGPFMRTYVKAIRSSREGNPLPFLLLVEEINRANVAAVFGDIFQLLDRSDDGTSEYPIQTSKDMREYLAKSEVLGGNVDDYETISIPSNMFIWATMNSADQGVFPMDTAFKRRWDFDYIGINANQEHIVGKTVVIGEDSFARTVEWNELRKAINDTLSSYKINEDKLLGPYFLSKKIINSGTDTEIDAKTFISAFKNKVLMYLFDDAAKQKRPSLFDGCKDSTKYSSICTEFDKRGVEIFCKEIRDKFPKAASDTENKAEAEE